MFQVLAGERKRRVISPTTIVASVAAHVLLLGGALYAAAGDGGEPGPVREDTTIVCVVCNDPPPTPAPEPTPSPAQPDQPANAPVPGSPVPQPSSDVPDGVHPEPPGVTPLPVDDLPLGPPGDVPGLPPANPSPPTGSTATEPVQPRVLDDSMVEKRPVLDRSGTARILERHYPAVLRDSRVSGRVVIEVIVDEDGRVREGSARVLEASHPAFGEAALRAADRFRFEPGEMAGVAVPVRVTIPIQWTVPR